MVKGARSNPKPKTKSKERSEEYRKYVNYIRSKQFKEVKSIVRERDKCCQFCGRGPEDGVQLSVHHRCYKHLYQGGEIEAGDCILICSREHRILHAAKFNLQWFARNNERNKTE